MTSPYFWAEVEISGKLGILGAPVAESFEFKFKVRPPVELANFYGINLLIFGC